MSQIDQILTNAALRYLIYAIIGILVIAIPWAFAIVWREEKRFRNQRKADQIAKEMNVARNLRGMR